MSRITIIAGPPGVGKTMMGQVYVPSEMEVIRKDDIIQSNKSFHYKLFQEIAIQKWLSTIKANLDANRDFAFELPLGMPMHYDFVLSEKQKNTAHKLNIILFFTDDLEMCKRRADARFKAGQHEVNPTVLENMYHNTIPLLKHHFAAIDEALLINSDNNNTYTPVGRYKSDNRLLETFDLSNRWYVEEIKPFIEDYNARRLQMHVLHNR